MQPVWSMVPENLDAEYSSARSVKINVYCLWLIFVEKRVQNILLKWSEAGVSGSRPAPAARGGLPPYQRRVKLFLLTCASTEYVCIFYSFLDVEMLH